MDALLAGGVVPLVSRERVAERGQCPRLAVLDQAMTASRACPAQGHEVVRDVVAT